MPEPRQAPAFACQNAACVNGSQTNQTHTDAGEIFSVDPRERLAGREAERAVVGFRMVRRVTTLGLAAAGLWLVLAGATDARARDLPPYSPVSEDLSEQRRAVYVRVDRRVDEDDLLAIAELVEAKGKKPFARTYVNFILPGMPVNQGAWASVLFAPEPKVMVHGLSRTDEELFLAEHKADTRPLLGSWLTSPPAAPGRLTIYSDHGKVFAEWRLRGGQKTVDELRDSTIKGVRRFDVPGGGYYVLTRSGELEIWDKSTLIATAERIRPDHLAAPAMASSKQSAPPAAARLASAQAAPSLLGATGMGGAAAAAMLAYAAQPEPAKASPVKSALNAAPVLAAIPIPKIHIPAAAPAAPTSVSAMNGPPSSSIAAEPVEPRTKSKKVTKSKPRQKVAAAAKSGDMTTGDTISAKISGRL